MKQKCTVHKIPIVRKLCSVSSVLVEEIILYVS